MSKRLTQEEFEEKFYKMYQGKYVVIGKYQNCITPVDIQCCKCGYILSQTPNYYDKGHTTCPICNKNGYTHLTIVGVNDIWTTRPDIAKLLLNPEDGYKYRFNTNCKLDFKCPICNRVRESTPKNFKSGFRCCFCSDSYSYPNRFMANLLDLLGISFIPEYIFSGYKYRYDFYFVLNNQRYIIEMDGGLGHGNADMKYATVKEQLTRDYLKDEIAESNGCIVIRIDCYYKKVETRMEFIKNNILNSELSRLFVFNDEMFIRSDEMSKDSAILKFVNAWNNNIHSYEELSSILHVVRHTIRNYAKKACDLELLDISYKQFLEEIRLASNEKLANTKGSPVLCEQTGEVFYSISEAERQKGITSLRSYFSKEHPRKFCGCLSDGTKLTWKKISKKEYQSLLSA